MPKIIPYLIFKNFRSAGDRMCKISMRKIRVKLSKYNEMKMNPNNMSEYRLNNSTLFERTLFRSCAGYKIVHSSY